MNIYFDKTHQRTFGTWPLRGKELTSALEIAIDIGYRSVDTAQMYGNESDIGASLTDLGLSRDGLCITTKVHPDNFGDADFMPSVEKSLEKLRLDCVDVLLLSTGLLSGKILHPHFACLKKLTKRVSLVTLGSPTTQQE